MVVLELIGAESVSMYINRLITPLTAITVAAQGSGLARIASLFVVVGCTLLCATQMSAAQTTGQTGNDQEARADVGGSQVEPHPGLGRPNPLRLSKPLRDANGNLFHHSGRPVEISASPIMIHPTSIDVMQVFIPWEFRVAGMFER